jgi:DNA mismatch repair protein MutL
MQDIIQLLPDSIANQIAAGEVVQRPASVVKELLENAIDARATQIRLVVKEAGRTLIQVIDDGIGMSPTDARLSFERHATSKIRTSDDLFKIHTKGFRGEALASVAAVAQVELRTRRATDELGTLIRMEASEIKAQEPCQTPVGTNLCVKNLFYNVPARRNFLKSNPVEMRHVIDEFQRVALAHPEVAMSLHHADTEVHALPTGKLSRRIVDLFGKAYREQLAACQEETPFLSVTGYIGKPDFAKKVRGEQFFFVNNRFIKHAYLHHAVLSAFEGLIPEGNHPFYVLNLTIDPAHIDINVHPTKTEIKFDDERSVYAIVRAAVKRATGVYNLAPSLDFDSDVNFFKSSGLVVPSVPAERGPAERGPALEVPPTRTPPKRNLSSWQQLFEGMESPTAFERHRLFPTREPEPERPAAPPAPVPPAEPTQNTLTFQSRANRLGTQAVPERPENEHTTFQLHNRYVLAQVKSGLMVIDQKAAYERILFEKYRQVLDKRTALSQQLLFPKTITLPAADVQLVLELEEAIRALGFDFAQLGRDAFVIYGVPADVADENEQELFEGLLDQYKRQNAELRLDRLEALARSLARRTAHRYTGRLSPDEMSALIDQLFASSNPHYTPGGEPTLTIVSLDRVAGLFSARS